MVTSPKTNALLAAVDDGIISWETIARASLNWMGENEVDEMCANSHDLEGMIPDDDGE